jgi:hypothetical protein
MHITFINGTPTLVGAAPGVTLLKLCRVDFKVDRVSKQLIPNSGTATILVNVPNVVRPQRVSDVPIR